MSSLLTASPGMVQFIVLFVALVLAFAPAFFMLFTMAAVFRKAGQPGWGILVPLYNGVLALRVAGKPWWWLLLSIIPVIPVLAALATARNFGKGIGFGLGLLFIPFVFYPILAFGSAEWHLVVKQKPPPVEEEEEEEEPASHEVVVDEAEDEAVTLSDVEAEESEPES